MATLPMLALATDSQADAGQDSTETEVTTKEVTEKKELDKDSVKALAKKAQNPVANMNSLQLQNNTNTGIGPDDGTQNMLNIIPVLPFKLSDDILYITRTIVPVTSQPDFLTGGEGRINGLGDTTFSSFLSPMKSDVTWGVGPIFLLPTATDDALGAEKWGAGLTAILLAQPGNWVYGGIVSNVWSIGGSGEKDINLFSLQYFINYNLDNGWYLMTSPIITGDWEADNDHRWTLPFGGGVGRVFRIGKQPVNLQLSAYWNVLTPDDYGADWQVRTLFQFLFPKK